MVAIDTDVFLIWYAFPRDPRFATAERFLSDVRGYAPAITLYNLMELLGNLSFNMSPSRLADWGNWLVRGLEIKIIWPIIAEGRLAEDFIREDLHALPLDLMLSQKMAYLDSLILGLTETTPEVDTFVTWNARHFSGKTSLNVVTPEEFLASMAK